MTKSMTDLLAGLACVVVAVVFYIEGMDLSPEAHLYPKILEIFTGVMGIFLLIRGLVTVKTSPKVAEVDFDKTKGIVTVIAAIIYVAGIKFIGFFVSTFVFLTLCSWYLSKKGANIKAFGVSLGFSIILTVLLYLLFKVILLVPTPEGLLM